MEADPHRSTIPLRRLSAVLPVLLLVSSCGEAPEAGPEGARGESAAGSSSESGWTTLRPGGETACATGDEYRFFARSADHERLVLYLQGGGACWNAETCVPEDDSPYVPNLSPGLHPDRWDGIFDLQNPENPVADYSMVVVPYCTGDVHLGDREATYALTGQDGESRTYSVSHRGQVNVAPALEWIRQNLDDPEQILVTGSSAGGVATPFYADQLARRYPNARVIGLGDAAGGYRSDSMKAVEAERWGVPGVLRRHEGWEDFGGRRLGTERLYLTASRGTPNLELYQVDQAYDGAQRTYLELAGSGGADLLQLLRSNRDDIREAMTSFRSFTVGGYEHTVMHRPHVYFYQTEGIRFRDWLDAILSGDSVPSVDCRDCDRPGVAYTESDLRLVDRTLELLSTEERWDSDHEGDCPETASRRSLRCAVIDAARGLGSRSVGSYPAAWDVVYTAVERLGEDRIQRPMIRYNNMESTGFEAVRGVLVDVRTRVRSALEERRREGRQEGAGRGP